MNEVRELHLSDAATWWSVPRAEVSAAIADRPLVVLLHGRGADERDLAGLVPALPRGYLYASVRAPLPVLALGRGYEWFPPSALDGVSPAGPAADAAARGVLSWLERTQARARHHGPVALLGFSQGGATAVQLLRHASELFAGAVVLSGFVTPGLVGGDEAMSQIRPPVFWGHDPADPVIPPAAASRLRSFLGGHADAEERTYPGAGHGITVAEAADVAGFLESVLRPTA